MHRRQVSHDHHCFEFSQSDREVSRSGTDLQDSEPRLDDLGQEPPVDLKTDLTSSGAGEPMPLVHAERVVVSTNPVGGLVHDSESTKTGLGNV